MAYTVVVSPAAARQLQTLPENAQEEILAHPERLSMNPRPLGSAVLPGTVDRYWRRRGEVRILYRVLDARELVQVLRISHRGDIYRRASPV